MWANNYSICATVGVVFLSARSPFTPSDFSHGEITIDVEPSRENGEPIFIEYIRQAGTLVGGRPSTLCNLPDIVGEFFFLDDEEMILISLDQAKILKALHK
jgi:hypothetical protein